MTRDLKERLRLPARLTRVSWRDLAVVGVPTLLVIAAAFAIAVRFVQPAPPSRIVMTAGTEGSAFRNYAERTGRSSPATASRSKSCLRWARSRT